MFIFIPWRLISEHFECKGNVNAGREKSHDEACQHQELVLASGYVTAVCLFAFRNFFFYFQSHYVSQTWVTTLDTLMHMM